MIRQRGLGLKIFIFTSILITFIITVVLGTLYFILPSYYLSEKNKVLERNANTLEIGLNKAVTEDQCAALISEFARTNNSTIISFDIDNLFLPQLSSPLLLMNDSKGRIMKFRHFEIIESDNDISDKGENVKPTTVITDNPMENQDMIEVADSSSKTAIYLHKGTSDTIVTKYLQNGIIGYITINSTLQPIDEAKGVIISLLPYLFMIAFIITLAAAYVFAKQLTKPILKISDAAELMQGMQQDVLSNVRTGDELGQLSYNLDSLYLNLCKNIHNLQFEMDKVSKLEQYKTDFMRAAGHELKTPIATLNGMVEGMIDNVGAYKNHEKYLNECKEQIIRLSKLVNEILRSSQLEQVEDYAVFEDVNISDIVEETIGMYKILIKKKQFQIIRDKFDFVYMTDSHILRNTLSNLISNAVNYTDLGGKIIISFTENENGNIFSIENQCDNIDEDMLPKLFEPFFTLNYSRDKTKSGTGLGLYIIKKNLDALKLPFEIENTEMGLKFSIIFEKSVE